MGKEECTVVPMNEVSEIKPREITEQETTSNTSSSLSQWRMCGEKIPKGELVFFAQIIPLYIVIIWCIVNLSMKRGDGHTWSILLGSCLGYILPNPRLTTKKIKHHGSVFHDSTQ